MPAFPENSVDGLRLGITENGRASKENIPLDRTGRGTFTQ
jgi:hypothetical protein